MTPTPQEHPYPDMIALMRMVRDDEEKWQAARSWFGGLPLIAPERWPRAKNGFSLPHLAQIDLSEVPRGPRTLPLPETGVLNVFGHLEDEFEMSVLYSAETSGMSACVPPADSPSLGGGHIPFYSGPTPADVEKIDSYRRWPIEFNLVEADGRTYPNFGQVASAMGPKPESIHVLEYTRLASFPSGRLPWKAVQRIVEDARYLLARHASHLEMLERERKALNKAQRPIEQVQRTLLNWGQGKLKDKPSAPSKPTRPPLEQREKEWIRQDRKLDIVREFIDRWTSRFAPHDPFDEIGDRLADALERELWALGQWNMTIRTSGARSALRNAAEDVYRDMLVGPEDVFARMPPEVRDYMLNDRRRSGWDSAGLHQMFGVTRRYGDEPDYFTREAGLFSLASDDMLSWLWGDVGGIDIWLSLDDLAARRWDRARGTFWGH